MTAFREALFANELIQFRLGSGQVLTRLTSNVERPPSNATAWRVADGPWITDMGGRYLETGLGKLVWQEATT